MIHVCFCLHDADGRYSKFTGTTIISIFENTRAEVTAHILHDDTLTDDNREKFLQLAARHNQRVEFYNVDKLCPDEIKFLRDELPDKINSRFNIGAFYRLLAKKILPVSRIIYLDSDIVVNLDIAELWQIDLKNFPIAAVPEIFNMKDRMSKNKFLLRYGIVDAEDYFNAGVILFDLERVSENFFRDGVQFLVDNPKCTSPAQDILNAFFAENYLKLESKFNSFVTCEDNRDKPADKKIYHYVRNSAGLDMSDGLQRLWFEIFFRSPWCDAQAMGRLYEEFSDYDTEIKTMLMNLSASLNGRKRAFITFAAHVDAIKNFFNADKSELIIIETFLDFDELIRYLKKIRKKCVFISMVENFTIMSNIFSDIGLVENKDFFNGLKFLAKSHGYRFNSYRFVKAM
ncbi:MAG: glycosyltransferase family 8 protein [Selenomonadaceae bacterium]|nr:glycosyltransferase family 8 protein [Selenomonadaceae bacterium]